MGKYRHSSRTFRHSRRNHRHRKSTVSYSRYRRVEKNRRRSTSRSNSENRKSRYSSPSPSSSSSSCDSSSSQSTARRVGHFRFHSGDILYGKYQIVKLLGDGTFGRVVQCKYKHKKYAIKIIKPVDRYIDSAKTQKSIIKQINRRDPDDQFGIVRYHRSFYHKGHFCMVFDPLGKSLYEMIKMNNFKGFPIKLVQSFFRQILRSIGFLHRIGYTHTDLKPENILLETRTYYENEQYPYQSKYYLPRRDNIRVIDFGGATKHDQYHSSIINTRQYRSPEVILQCCKWDEISDVWSIGCIICELYTGELFFPTHSDQEHIAMIEKNCGRYPHWMVTKMPPNHSEKRLFRDGFVNQEKLERSQLQNVIALKSLQQIFVGYPALIDLLQRCLTIDPNRRINCSDALRHSFFLQTFE